MTQHTGTNGNHGTRIEEAKISDKPGTFVFTHEALASHPTLKRELAQVMDGFIEHKLKVERAEELLAQLAELEVLNVKVTIEKVPTPEEKAAADLKWVQETAAKQIAAAKEQGRLEGDFLAMRKVRKIATVALPVAAYAVLIGTSIGYGRGVGTGTKAGMDAVKGMGALKAARWFFSK